VEIATGKLKRYKSPGTDQILAELIKAGGKTCSEIHILIHSIWNKEELPQQWKESIIVPIHKKCDKTDCNNYQGISFLATAYKILSMKLLGIINVGFHHNRFTTNQILYICQLLEKKWEHNGTVHLLFTGFKKTYDSVKRKVPYSILLEFGIPKKLVRQGRNNINLIN
jgi:hypothetical protein